MTDPTKPTAYTVRHGFTPMLVFCVVLFLGLAGGFSWMLSDPQISSDRDAYAFFVPAIAVFVAIGLALLIGPLRRSLALRVDQDGVTLGRSTGVLTHHGGWWRLPKVVTVPWRDIDGIVLFQLYTPGATSLPFIGVRLRPGALPPPGEPTEPGFWPRLSRWLGQELPPEDVPVYRQIFAWRLDEEQLRKAINAYSQGVKVTGGV